MTATPSFFARLGLALTTPMRLLFDGEFAARVLSASSPTPALTAGGSSGDSSGHSRELPAETKPGPAQPGAQSKPIDIERDTSAALQVLSIMQREGRLLDFLSESVAGFTDADIAAAARVVHAGCRRAVDDYFEITPLRSESEGEAVELPPGYDAARTRVTGNVVGRPPYRGTLAHHGWQVTAINLPELLAGHDPTIVAPAEVEL